MIDTHCHLDASRYDPDRAEVLKRAFAAGVEHIVIPAIGPEGFEPLLALAASDTRLACGIGIHPHEALKGSAENLQRVRELSGARNVVAVGEIGLDYYYDFAPADIQQTVFREQLRIAKEMDLPVIVHNREAGDDVLRIVEAEQDGSLRGVFHCFSGSPEELAQALKLGFLVSFTGNITFKKSTLGPTVADAPLEKVMLETDGPYMSPVPHRGKRNEPSFVRFVAEKIAEFHSTSFEEVVSMTTQSAKRLFRLVLALFFIHMVAFAQDEDEEYEYYDEDEEFYEEEEEVYNPYPKFLGIGPSIGTNTIVETIALPQGQSQDISYDGLLAYGATISYGISDHLLVQASYLYAKNSKVVETDDQTNPNVHQLVDLSFHFTPNPYNTINFYGSVGPSWFDNEYDGRIKDSHFGINGGISLVANIETAWGLLTPVMEWRVSAILGDRKLKNVDDEDEERSFFSSIPRLNVLWYPSF